jgi:transcription termination factor NusB
MSHAARAFLELARTFSTEESVKFINGMLDGVRKKIDRH